MNVEPFPRSEVNSFASMETIFAFVFDTRTSTASAAWCEMWQEKVYDLERSSSLSATSSAAPHAATVRRQKAESFMAGGYVPAWLDHVKSTSGNHRGGALCDCFFFVLPEL